MRRHNKFINDVVRIMAMVSVCLLAGGCTRGNAGSEGQENGNDVEGLELESSSLSSSLSGDAVGGSNDQDPNLRGYRYKYDKQTAYEDGRFDNDPDYIAIPCKLRGKSEQLLFRKGYAISYNQSTKQANWVGWHLTRSHSDGDVQRPQRAFHDDDDVPNSTHYWDYDKARQYDRGHMCPAADNRWDSDAMMETFLMSNVCPQYRGLNSGVWNDIEIKCREWAKSIGDVYIVCGPIFNESGTSREYIGASRIPVPDAFFKVVVSNHGKGKGIGFICPNRSGSDDLNDYSVSIDDVEKITGIDFFPALPDDIEERIEGEVGRWW